MGLQYSKFVPILVKALQELSAKNDALEARIATLEG
jgi:cell division protein FtsB